MDWDRRVELSANSFKAAISREVLLPQYVSDPGDCGDGLLAGY